MRIPVLAAALVLGSALLVADEKSITFDSQVDFSRLKTFAIHAAKITSTRPELDNTLFAKKIGDVIRAALVAKKLTETDDRPDLVVDATVTGQDYSIGSAGRANPIAPPRGGGSRSFEPVAFTEATLVVDLNVREPFALAWHGVYREKDNASKLAEKIPDGAKKLLSEYPPRKK